ncbi:unnamed protein product [Periconia digitata]|uniref:Uncharacterized protein n=1 Tax=Periconia digitata TaxID=1303443 RepID=A0A9W4UN89_9PLEO|nr:unnamed protein product [Periconia digitata]
MSVCQQSYAHGSQRIQEVGLCVSESEIWYMIVGTHSGRRNWPTWSLSTYHHPSRVAAPALAFIPLGVQSAPIIILSELSRNCSTANQMVAWIGGKSIRV